MFQAAEIMKVNVNNTGIEFYIFCSNKLSMFNVLTILQENKFKRHHHATMVTVVEPVKSVNVYVP